MTATERLLAVLAVSPEVRPGTDTALLAEHDAEVRAAHNETFAAWLLKKAAEYRSIGGAAAERRQHILRAEAIEHLADKARRGAIRTNNLLMPSGAKQVVAPALSESERQFLTFALELAADQMASDSTGFTAEDDAALKSLRALAAEGGAAA